MNRADDLAWLRHIGWDTPWLHPWRVLGAQLQAAVLDGMPLWEALNAVAQAPVRFVAHSLLPAATPYECFVHDTGTCPVRAGLHDFFNGLCWLNFPQSKRRLNQLQCEQIGRDGIGAARGAVRDAVTLFDENAALLWCPDALWTALQRKDWDHVFGALKPLWCQAQLQLFGHALLEKLERPRVAITAHVYRTPHPLSDRPALDRWLAGDLTSAGLAGKPFAPLPVLGVPGWWPANQQPGFYDDRTVFRPPHRDASGSK